MKIFVSSTYIDLQNHRMALDEIINRLSHQYRGMEYFGSREFAPKHVCFEEISACELFIGIYAHRYGWVPEKDTKSITEQEYDFAQSLDISCHLYVVKKSHPWNPEFIEAGKNKKLLAAFKNKIKDLTLSEFTTPDDLSKKVAADIANFYSNPNITHQDFNQLSTSLNKFCIQDIKTNIGPKYIPDLFVKRIRSQKYKSKIKSIPNAIKPLLSIANKSKKILDLIERNKECKKILAEHIRKDSEKKKHDQTLTIITKLSHLVSVVQNVSQKSFVEQEVCFPALEIRTELDNLRKLLNKINQGLTSVQFKNEIILNIIDNIDSTKDNIVKFTKSIKPITLLIDRAGGGKTNLLCDLTIELSLDIPVFFISAKSVAAPTEQSILDYVKKAYPISQDPVGSALAAAEKNNSPILLIIDGINEHYDPLRFNLALKSFVKRYYKTPLRFLMSCRDIYWKFFEDNWWIDNCDEIIKDELYSFNAKEFKTVFPKYLKSYHIKASVEKKAKKHLRHPLLLRFFCEAYKGNGVSPTLLGIVNDVRLLPLFDTYCNRKYEQIRERLQLLSTNEISEFVSMLGLMMLKSNNRFIPCEKIRKRALQQFGENSLYSSKSKYVHILDEDIVIEQIPGRSIHNLNVEFVYDEFMEYIIATAKYAEVYNKGIDAVLILVDALLERERFFVSVSGILVFIGEMVAENSTKDGYAYIERLIEKEKQDLVCKIISRWPEDRITDKIVELLIDLHRNGKNNHIRSAAWQAFKNIYWRYWDIIFEYITTMPTDGSFRLLRVFSFLKRTKGGVSHADKFRSLCWIGESLKNNFDNCGGDFKSGKSAFLFIAESNKNVWNDTQKNKINTYINIIQ